MPGRPARSVTRYSARVRKAISTQPLINLRDYGFEFAKCRFRSQHTFSRSEEKPRHPLPSQPRWTALYLRLVSPAAARVVRNDHTTSIVSQHSLHVTTTRSPASRLLVVPIDQDDPHGYSGSYFANQTRPFSFLASQPVITKDLVFPPLSGSTPHPALLTPMPNYRGPRWRLTSPPTPNLKPKIAIKLVDQKIILWHFRSWPALYDSTITATSRTLGYAVISFCYKNWIMWWLPNNKLITVRRKRWWPAMT